MFWNNRFIRISIGVLLLGAAIIALLPTITGYTSLDGTVNARFALIAAPIEGTVQDTPPKVGSALREGDSLLAIRNHRINRAVLSALSAELETARDRVDGLNDQRAQLARLRDDLAQRLGAYQQASIHAIEQEIAIIRQRLTINEAQQTAANAELQRRQMLGTSGIVAGSQVEQARAAQVTSAGEGRVAAVELERLHRRLDALRQGVYVGDGRNDVPYSRQRQDEVAIQLADLDARIKENAARVEQIEKQLAEEQERIRRQEYVEMRMPFSGVVWRNSVVAGSNVIVGTELQRILDCRDLFVDVLVAEIDYDEIYPGRSAHVRLLGRESAIAAEVVSVRGSAAVVEETILAATPPQGRGRTARIRLALRASELNTDFANFCQVGRTVQVRFESRRLPIRQWINALWFSIT